MVAAGGVAFLLILVGIPWIGVLSAAAAAAGVTGEGYVRPPPRIALSLPWGRARHSPDPHQVITPFYLSSLPRLLCDS